jgi:hypothetical protein
VFFDINGLFEQSQSFLRDANKDEEISKYQSQQQLRFNASRSETKDIKLTTEEGDIVTISSADQFQASYLSFDYSGITKGQAMDFSAEKFQSSSQSSFNISVAGDLNEEEKEDIAHVLDQMDEIMADLIAGDLEEVMIGAISLIDETDTITGMDAVLEFHQEISMEQRVITQMQGEGIGPPPPHRPPHPPLPEAAQNGEQRLFSGSRLVAQISNSIMELIEQSSVEQQKMEQPINDLFANFMDKLSLDPKNPESSLKSQLLAQIQDNVNELFPEVQAS